MLVDNKPGESIEDVMELESEAIDPGEEGDNGDEGAKDANPPGIAKPWVN